MNISFFVLLGLFFSSLSQIELPLYKSQKNNDIISFNNATIESIEHSHFLTDLKLGSPMQSIPLEISMTSDEILILNNKNNIYKKKILSEKTSRTYQVVKSTKENKIPAIDKFVVYKNGFDLQFKSVEKLKLEDEDEASSGILGFSLGDIDDKHKNKFVNQLSQKSLISNSIFYFDFEQKHSKNEVTSLEEYLNIRGKLMIGEYPSSII